MCSIAEGSATVNRFIVNVVGVVRTHEIQLVACCVLVRRPFWVRDPLAREFGLGHNGSTHLEWGEHAAMTTRRVEAEDSGECHRHHHDLAGPLKEVSP